MIESTADAVRATRDLQAVLEGRGDLHGALCLCKATGAFYSTTSEALIAILEALKEVRETSSLEGRELEQLSTMESAIAVLLDLH